MIKELHLVARAIYTLVAVLCFSTLSGFSFTTSFMAVGILIFLNSFMFQYFVLHWAMKNVVATVRGRLWFLIGTWIVTLAGLVVTTIMIPSFESIDRYPSAEAFLKACVGWGAVYVIFATLFVALTCTRRAFDRHGGLG